MPSATSTAENECDYYVYDILSVGKLGRTVPLACAYPRRGTYQKLHSAYLVESDTVRCEMKNECRGLWRWL
jgi:hypothetical protein